MTVAPLVDLSLPGGFIADLSRAAPEVGGYCLIVWRNARRDDGLIFYVDTLRAATEALTGIRARWVKEGRA